jgi:dihydrodipicolinate synthase/N-acetylneuraminate lyase
MFNGAISAIITPFRDGAVDVAALRDLVEWQIASGIDGIVPCGSTGESATLTHSEHEQVIKLVVDQTRRRVPVIAGTGSNSTAEAIRLTAFAREIGADGALQSRPITTGQRRTASFAITRPSRTRLTCRCSFTTSRVAPDRISLPRLSPA